MDPEKILAFWCDPFSFARSISESDILQDKMPIVFMGGRGTGKTMFLKYFSYQVQIAQASIQNQTATPNDIEQYFKQMGGIGFYVRIDSPTLRSFEGKGLNDSVWSEIFSHYFELTIARAYLEVFQDLASRGLLSGDSFKSNFLPALAKQIGMRDYASNISNLANRLDEELEYVTSFRSKIVFSRVKFEPRKLFSSQYLSSGIVDLTKKHLPNLFDKLNFVIFLDEYENFSAEQQKLVNTLVKFVRKGMTFRLGMRLEGFRTYDTIRKEEFIKEGRDYQKVVFEDVLNKDKNYQAFLVNVAKKRLEAIPALKLKGFVNIVNFLGEKQDLEAEAKCLLKGRKTPTRHFQYLKLLGTRVDLAKSIKLLSMPKNPLLEMLNILWVLRGQDSQAVHDIMKAYLGKKKSKETAKYRMDYVDKYKLSLMFLLCSAYHTNKKYYSFNTFCYLSSGIVGNFIELCRRSFQNAYFMNHGMLLNDGIIAPDLQDQAAKDLSATELQMITRIHTYGDNLHCLATNLGNIFRAYHTDIYLKYPETNQFAIDEALIQDAFFKEAFRMAIRWSVIQRKPQLQRASPSSARKEIYTLNRILSPVFQITYRTRGGFSEEYSQDQLKKLMTQSNAEPQVRLQSGFKNESDSKQLELSDSLTL